MVTTNYKIAYSEVLEILKHISEEEYNKIPNDMIELFKTNANNDNEFVYNPNKTLEEQNVSETARTIIAILFRDYWATETQKEKIIAKQNYDRKKIKEEKYNYNNLFNKNKKETEIQEEIKNNEVDIIPYKESIFKRIINKIKDILFKK